MKSISRWQLRSREAWWEGSLRQNHEAMNKNVIKGLASGASEPSIAKPSGLGRRVNGALAWWKLVFLSGEISHSGVMPLGYRSFDGNVAGELGEVSRRHSSRMKRAGSSCRRVTRPAKISGGLTCDEGQNRNDKSRSFCSSCGYSPTGEAQAWREEGSLDAGRGWLVSANRFHYPTTVR
jgi:hypothetical protein